MHDHNTLAVMYAAEQFTKSGMHVLPESEYAEYQQFRDKMNRIRDIAMFIRDLEHTDIHVPLQLAMSYAKAVQACEEVGL